MTLLLTVGTGTAGRYSFLAEGLIASIRLAGAERFVLVPSRATESIEVARYVLDDPQVGPLWEPLDNPGSFPCVGDPDDLESCRRHLLGLIADLRRRGHRDIRLNPTSGTKQMSAAAILAGLESGVTRIDYTIGERSDGVVRTGTERLQAFDPASILLRRALDDALRLMRAGAFHGAAELLRPFSRYEQAGKLQAGARMMEEWMRLRHADAAGYARRMAHPDGTGWAGSLDRLAGADAYDPLLLADLLDLASFHLDCRSPEIALAALYRATEQLAKVVMAGNYGLRPPYRVEAFERLMPGQVQRLRALAFDGLLHLGLHMAMDCLRALDEPIGIWFFVHPQFRGVLEQRHQTPFGHGLGSVELAHVRRACNDLHQAVCEHTAIPAPAQHRRAVLKRIAVHFENSDS
jgi:hypothetical protein